MHYRNYFYVNCINALIYTCLIIKQLFKIELLYVICLFRDDYALIDNTCVWYCNGEPFLCRSINNSTVLTS